mmetsp:Transcript_32067/g.44455  ORF Transcript_32067/g.44455 Transcript_32067/m.44455 type:complete len:124 (-) Transcript_32067:1-372(-)
MSSSNHIIPEVKHHGYWLKLQEPGTHGWNPPAPPVKLMPALQMADTFDRLYTDAETRQGGRGEQPPVRHQQGGIEFEFEASKNQYYSVRKEAKVMGKEDYDAAMVNQSVTGVEKKKEKNAKPV